MAKTLEVDERIQSLPSLFVQSLLICPLGKIEIPWRSLTVFYVLVPVQCRGFGEFACIVHQPGDMLLEVLMTHHLA